jgi:cobalt-zinc-cadmium efflux system protein
MRLLSAGKDTSLNLKGAYLEVWSDMLGSVGVIIGALVIRLTGWGWVDSAIAVGIGLWVLPRTWILLRESVNVLLEGVPEGIGIAGLLEAISAVPGVTSIHDLHVWSISSGKTSLTVHIVSHVPQSSWPNLTAAVRAMLAHDFKIGHTTVQLENTPCDQDNPIHEFGVTTGHAHT